MPHAFQKLLQVQYLDLSTEEIRELPVHAIKGVSQADADHLKEAFGIDSIGEMAENHFFQAAQALTRAGTTPGYDSGPPFEWEQIFSEAPLIPGTPQYRSGTAGNEPGRSL